MNTQNMQSTATKSNISYDTRIRAAAEKYNFRFKKSLGQNFLTDKSYLTRIIDAADLCKDDAVVEIGPGMGFLTERLCNAAGLVYTAEVDKLLCTILGDAFADTENLMLLHEDGLKLDYGKLHKEAAGRGYDKEFKIVANLPYYITSPLIMSFAENAQYWQKAVIMVQKEVAQRLCAKPGSKDYGVLTLETAFHAEAGIVTTVPAKAFTPKPKVDSAVVMLEKRDNPPCPVEDKKTWRKIIKAAFAQRRKTIANAYRNSGMFPGKEAADTFLNQCGIDGQRRAEELSFEEYTLLANTYFRDFR